MQSNDDIQRIAKEISEYLTVHPDAKDSVEGITKWWLARQHFEDSVSKVQQALDYLESQNLIKKNIIADGRSTYSKPLGDVTNQ